MEASNVTGTTFRKLIETPDVPDLGLAPRATRLLLVELNRKIEGFFQATEFSSALQPSVRSAALLWHDYLKESPALSQNITNTSTKPSMLCGFASTAG